MIVAQLCLTLWDPIDCSLCPWNSSGKNTGVGSHSLLQGIELGSSWVSCIASKFFTFWTTKEALDPKKEVKVLVAQSCLTLFDHMDSTVAHQAPLSMDPLWSELPFPSPGGLPNPKIEPGSTISQADSLLSEPKGLDISSPRPLVAKSVWSSQPPEDYVKNTDS